MWSVHLIGQRTWDATKRTWKETGKKTAGQFQKYWHQVAETEGFEPSVPVRVLHLSRVVH